MKPKSISGIIFHVRDIPTTAEFYETLGFRLGTKTDTTLTCYVNWFWIEFQLEPTLTLTSSSIQSLAINIDDLEGFYAEVLDHGYHPETQISKSGARSEFTLRDPNGHLLTFFHK